MESPAFSALLAPIARVKWLTWLAFNAATIFYVVLAYSLFASRGSIGTLMPGDPRTMVLAVLGLITAFASRSVPALVMPDRRLRELLARDPDPQLLARDSQTGEINAGRLEKIKSLTPHEQRLLAATSSLFVSFVIQLAFGEAVWLYGLLLSFWTQTFLSVLPFAAVALVLNLSVSPKLDAELERLRKLAYQPSATGAA